MFNRVLLYLLLGVLAGDQIVFICGDGRVFCRGGCWRDGWVIESSPRRSLSLHEELLSIWGKACAEHPQPWSPLAREHQRANLLLYWIGPRGPELLAYKKTEGEPILVVVSKRQNKNLIVVEQKVTQRGKKGIALTTF